MRIKFFKSVLFIFILMICSAIALGIKNYQKTIATFKPIGSIMVVSMSENTNFGYNELKTSIDQKYTQEFVKILNNTQSELKCGMADILGDDYQNLTREYDEITEYITAQIKTFNNLEEYTVLKDKLAVLKGKIDSVDKSSKEEYLDEFRGVLGEISTLNNKFNNQLKDKRDRLVEIKGEIKELFVKNKEALIKLRKEKMDKTREDIKTLVHGYSIEIKELNDTFNVNEKFSPLPFDVSSMQDFMIAGKVETECFNEILENNAVIFSENDAKLPS
ncbi:MAG: hypothetical protein J6V66_07035 [Clostridia bacterium]|nr:hypothetical protein [Clostridia bacterium]